MMRLARLADACYAPRSVCPVCGAASDDGFCPSCTALLDLTRSRQQLEGERSSFIVHAAGFYNNFLKRHFAAYKFEGRSCFRDAFSNLMREHIQECRALSDVRYLSYIPMYPRQRMLRGYNPIGMITEKLACDMALPIVRLLCKGRPAKEQNKLTRIERLTNLGSTYESAETDGGFRFEYCEASEFWTRVSARGRIEADALRGVKGLLLDDFITTGQTLRSVMDVLADYDLDLQVAVLATAHRVADAPERSRE